jgi:hypothetical protein
VAKNLEESANMEEKKGISLYPNPVSSIVYVRGLKVAAYLEVYNSLGQCKLKGSGRSIDVSSLEPGVYFLKIGSGEKTGTYKFIKKN